MYYSNNLNDITNQINLVRSMVQFETIYAKQKKMCFPLCVVHPLRNWMRFELENRRICKERKQEENQDRPHAINMILSIQMEFHIDCQQFIKTIKCNNKLVFHLGIFSSL